MKAAAMLVGLLCLGPASGVAEDKSQAPSLELLEYLAGLEETPDGQLLDPLDLEATQQPVSYKEHLEHRYSGENTDR